MLVSCHKIGTKSLRNACAMDYNMLRGASAHLLTPLTFGHS